MDLNLADFLIQQTKCHHFLIDNGVTQELEYTDIPLICALHNVAKNTRISSFASLYC
jgi:hypothetical protein